MGYLKNLCFLISTFVFIYLNYFSGWYLWPYYGGLVKLISFSYFSFNSYNCFFFFGIDGISFWFLWLSSLVIFLCVFLEFRNESLYKSHYNNYLNSNYTLFFLLSVEFLLFICFSSFDIFIFVVSFEFLIIPMFFLIGLFGSQSNGKQIRASYYFFFYSFIFSLFSIFVVIYLYEIANTTNVLLLINCAFLKKQQILLSLCFLFTFCSKIPVLPFHIWLPQAHVEAPTVGSIVLACLLLKLGGYGFIRFLLPLFHEGVYFFLPLINCLCFLGVVYCSFAAIYQVDLKKIIAYSSVSHMNLATLGIFSLNEFSMNGAVLMMISHGISSMSLFLLAGILYEQWKTRCILYLGGLFQVQPLLFVYNFFFFMANSSIPGSSNFISEFLILLGFFSLNLFICFLIIIGSTLSLVYSLRTLSFIFFGNLPSFFFYEFNLSDINFKEKLCLDFLLVLSILLGIRPSFILLTLQLCLKELILYY